MGMKYPLEPGDFKQPETLRSLRQEWKAERIGWLLMALLILVALLGGFGQGPLAHASRAAGPLQLHYDRLVRRGVSTRFQLTVLPEPNRPAGLTIWIAESFLEAAPLQEVSPEPNQRTSADGRLVLEFAAPPPGEPSHIILTVLPRRAGQQRGELGFPESPRLQFGLFVFP
jgi:hypothetical protein